VYSLNLIPFLIWSVLPADAVVAPQADNDDPSSPSQVDVAEDLQAALSPSDQELPPLDDAPDEEDPLAAMRDELNRLRTEYDLLLQRQRNSMLEIELEKQRLNTQQSLRKVLEDETLADLQKQTSELNAEAALAKAKRDQELAELKAAIEREKIEKELQELHVADQVAELQAKTKVLAAENALRNEEVNQTKAELEVVKQKYGTQITELKGALELRGSKDELNERVVDDIDYLKDPFVDGTLYITDRRISLNGPIIYGTAEYVADRIHFFNNQSKELPIFLVIDFCPGGSAMQGYRIVKAVQSSPAPVYVVVKSFAASMAAIITTLADRSYAYPNAIILHHQMSTVTFGNLTQQKEQLKSAQEWSRRLLEPVAAKMDVTLDRFVAMMYEHNSNGDWDEFADQAQQLKWIDGVAGNIQEIGIRERPTGGDFEALRRKIFADEEVDEKGNPFVRLPKLRPFDHYFVYNPDNYYR